MGFGQGHDHTWPPCGPECPGGSTESTLATIDAGEPLRPGKPPSSYARVTADEAMATEFTMTRLRAGYLEGEVDDFIDRIWATLRRYEDNSYLLLGLIGRLHGVQDKLEVAEIAAKMTEVIEAWPKKTT